MDASSLVGATAAEIAAAVRDGQVTAVDVTEAHLTRIDELNPQVGAFTRVLHDRAREDAAAVDARDDRDELPLAGVPLALIHGHLYAKYTRWALTPDLLLFHRGWLWRRLAVVPRNRIQAIRLTRSPFDRRYRMSELEVDTAGGGLGKRRVRLPYLDRRVAARLGSALYH